MITEKYKIGSTPFSETKLKDAYNGIDKHDRHYRNLFLAYFDLRDKAGDENED